MNMSISFQPLRCPRKEALRLLKISHSTAVRREAAGLLTPLKDHPNGWVFYQMREVMALAGIKDHEQLDNRQTDAS
jgi:hypothetical protein